MLVHAPVLSFMKAQIFIIVAILLFTACSNDKQPASSEQGRRLPVKYARGFVIEKMPDAYKLTVRDPLDTLRILATYYLSETAPVSKDHIKVPVQRLVSFSTTHVGFLDALGVSNSLVGFSGSTYICNDAVRNRVAQGAIVEVGNEGGIDHEKIITLHPDMVMTYLTGNAAYDQVDKLSSLGIQAVINNEFMELSPLGQAEWIKFIAMFYGKWEEAVMIFNTIEASYQETAALVADKGERPLVFTGMAYKGEWTIPGGKSFAARYIHDAGGSYLWETDEQTGNFPISFETMVSKASHADIWLHPGAAATSSEILEADPRYGEFDALNDKHVFNNNARMCAGGGNDYWERGIVYPNEVLADLVAIFHPEVMRAHTFIFYTHLP